MGTPKWTTKKLGQSFREQLDERIEAAYKIGSIKSDIRTHEKLNMLTRCMIGLALLCGAVLVSQFVVMYCMAMLMVK